ncbi:hypothetical protein PMAYCL1PPCAC_18639, partial [Pristionchus mayeri]
NTRPIESPVQQQQQDTPTDNASIVLPRASPPVDQMSLNEDHLAGETFLPSLSSLPPANSESQESDALCRVEDRLDAVGNKQKTNNESSFDVDLLENPSWESLPLNPLERIFPNLLTDGNCIDLAHLSEVSTNFRSHTKEFMMRRNNRPVLKKVYLERADRGGILVLIVMFPSNTFFHDHSGLDWSRFQRVMRFAPTLRVSVMGAQDPILDQVVRLLAGSIKSVEIDIGADFSPHELSLAAQLFRGS